MIFPDGKEFFREEKQNYLFAWRPEKIFFSCFSQTLCKVYKIFWGERRKKNITLIDTHRHTQPAVKLIINGKAQNTRNISDELFCLEGRRYQRGTREFL